MSKEMDVKQFDENDTDSAVFRMFTISELKDIEEGKLKLLLDHDRKLRRLRAAQKLILALIAAIPTIMVMLRQFM